MFTGIIEHQGIIESIKLVDGGLEIGITSTLTNELNIDDSVSVNGVCQTVVKKTGSTIWVQAVEETLRKTTFGELKQGEMVNLEDSLTLQKKIDGHIVQGHVDCTGSVIESKKEGMNWLFKFSYPEEFAGLLVGRGSIAIDGISLTVARLTDSDFTVAVIPYTFENTALCNRKVGSKVNLEFDILGKYVQRLISLDKINRQSESTESDSDISMDWLSGQGII